MRSVHESKKANVRVLLFSLFLCLFGIVVIGRCITTLMEYSSVSRMTIAVIGDPYYLVSWDVQEHSFLLIPFSPDVRIEAVHGYGEYPIRGIYSLDVMEKRRGVLCLQSLEDAFGLPIQYIYDRGEKNSYTTRDKYAVLRDMFSFSHIVSFIRTPGQSTMPLHTFIRLSFATMDIGAGNVHELDPASVMDLFVEGTLPDGTNSVTFNPLRFDSFVSTNVEQKELREEGYTVSIQNTTAMPGLAQKAARLIEKSGIHVLSLGSIESGNTSACVVRGSKKILRSKTATFVSRVLGCKPEPSEEPEKADLTVFLGTEFLSRYEPFKK